MATKSAKKSAKKKAAGRKAGSTGRSNGLNRFNMHALDKKNKRLFSALQSERRDYAGFADQAHFGWVTSAWRAVVAPNQYLFIGLLVAFEAVVGVLILSGGRRTQLGLVGAIGFHLALWLFGWFVTIYSLIMLPVLVLLLRAERRAATVSATTAAPASVSSVEMTSPNG